MLKSDLPASSKSVKNVRQLLLTEFSSMPTGGTFKLSLNGLITAPIAWNASADAVQTALQAILGNYRVAVYGGPAPSSPFVVIFLGDYTATVQPLITVDTTGLTGGTGITTFSRYLVDDDAEAVSISTQPKRIDQIYSGDTAPNVVGAYNSVETGNMQFTLDGNGSLHLSTNNPAASLSATFYTNALDVRNMPLEFQVYNPLPYLLRAQLVFSNNRNISPPNTAPGITIPPGWTSIFFHGSGLISQTTADMRSINGVRFFINSYNQQDFYDPSSTLGIFLDEVSVAPREEPCVMIGWDDGLINVYNIAHNIISRYPRIKHTLFVVKSWVLSGKRSFDNSPTMSLAQIHALHNTGQYLIANHSANHYRFETGINPNYTDATAIEQVIRWKPTTGFPTSGTFRITIDGLGTTTALPYNATIRQLVPALEALVGVGNVAITSWTTLQLSSSFGLRVVFSTPVPIMQVTDPDGNLNQGKILAGPAFSVADIVADYEENRAWLVANGFTGGERIVAYPEGSYGPTVNAAMQILVARGARLMVSRANSFAVRQTTFEQTKYAMPAFDFQSTVTKLIQQLEVFSLYGGGFSVMMHDINKLNGNPNVSNEQNLETLLSHLDNARDRFSPKTYKEYFDLMDSRGFGT